ncbi:MAG: ABC transporter permease, partial [Planctomycetes bacterium]|nr:ABC transporter permease [Planctomycetota bacterium]
MNALPLTRRRLARRGLRFYWRTHLGVVLGTACAAAVLTGALGVGDSVRHSLRDQALLRIGKIDCALHAGDRMFGADLADRIAGHARGATTAPVLLLPGVARLPEGGTRSAIVDVLGVDSRFFRLSSRGAALPDALGPGTAALGRHAAQQLGAAVGTTLVVRVQKPSAVPRDMVLSTIDDVSFAVRVRVAAVLDDADFGRFGLRASQLPPFLVFLDLASLQNELKLGPRANTVLVAGADEAAANAALRATWTLDDAELRIRDDPSGFTELTSRRIFLDDSVVDAVEALAPNSVALLTYLVNALRHGARTTPYSMVTAVGPLHAGAPAPAGKAAALRALLPASAGPDAIVLNSWAADDLAAKPGDPVDLSFFVMDARQQLRQATHTFRVHAVVPLQGAAADRTLMPEFPGLTDTADCKDWETGVPMDLAKIRDKDERYWDDHRGTPKAFVPYATGRELWRNRFGRATAIRGAPALGKTLRTELRQRLDPRALGLFFTDVRGPALAASAPATDFGGLFLGLSMFLMAAALLLTALLFAFGVAQRAGEIGLLLAVGLPPRTVRRLFLREALLLALLGSAAGAFAGIGYAAAVLHGLGGLWRGAVGSTTLALHVGPRTLQLWIGLSVLCALGAMALTLRRCFAHPAVALLKSHTGLPAADPRSTRPTISVALAVLLL